MCSTVMECSGQTLLTLSKAMVRYGPIRSHIINIRSQHDTPGSLPLGLHHVSLVSCQPGARLRPNKQGQLQGQEEDQDRRGADHSLHRLFRGQHHFNKNNVTHLSASGKTQHQNKDFERMEVSVSMHAMFRPIRVGHSLFFSAMLLLWILSSAGTQDSVEMFPVF